MCSSVSLMSIIALLVMDVRIGALQQEMKSQECHQCVPANSTTMCEQPSDWISTVCSSKTPYCATVAIAPNFRSTLTCSAENTTSCSLKYSAERTLQLTCVCKDNLCNVPLSQKLRDELLNFSSKNNSSVNLTETFYKIDISANATELNFYKEIITDVTEATEPTFKNTSQLTTLLSVYPATTNSQTISRHSELPPRAEALKQDTTPSDDDEDESEGSGTYEDARTHNNAASAPAAPSSFLPANESGASSMISNLILITSLAACNLV